MQVLPGNQPTAKVPSCQCEQSHTLYLLSGQNCLMVCVIFMHKYGNVHVLQNLEEHYFLGLGLKKCSMHFFRFLRINRRIL